MKTLWNGNQYKRTLSAGLAAVLAIGLVASSASTAEAQIDFQVNGNRIFQFHQGGNGGQGTQFSKSQRNGVTTTSLVKDGTKIKVEESSDSVVVEVTRTYGPGDAKDLQKDHPKVAKAMESFPKESGKASVELKVTLSQTFEAIDAEDLKEESESGYAYYQKVKEFEKKSPNSGRRGIRINGFRDFGGFGDIERLEQMLEEQDKMFEKAFKGRKLFEIRPRNVQPPKKRKIKGIAT